MHLSYLPSLLTVLFSVGGNPQLPTNAPKSATVEARSIEKKPTDKLIWEATRATSPSSRDELRALESRVKKIYEERTPCTVGILVGMGSGSGVIISEDGLVLTAAHVIVKPGENLRIVLPNGELVNGKSLGVNAKLDSGMVKITGKPPKDAKWPGAKDGKWPFAEIGDTAKLKAGQWIITMGHPGGPRRDRPPPLRVGRFEAYDVPGAVMRTNCTMVGGDSGGPVYDLDGKVVGINSRIGFLLETSMHVPTKSFRDEWDRLVAGEKIDRAGEVELGAVIEEDDDNVLLGEITPGGPADKAGLKKGDILKKFHSESIGTTSELTTILAGLEPGDHVEVVVERDGETVEIQMTLGKKKKAKEPKKLDEKKPEKSEKSKEKSSK